MSIASDALAKKLRPLFAKKPEVVEKRIIGGIGFMLNGNLAVGTTPRGELLVRIDPAKAKSALARSGAFQPKMGEREMLGYLAVGPDIVDDPDELKAWVRYALDYARTLPVK